MTEPATSSGQPLDVTAILQAVNTGGAGTFTLLAPLRGGESGQPVFELAGRDGRRYLLKCRSDARGIEGWRAAARVATVLRRRGYPAPEHLLIGQLVQSRYVVQELLPGEPVRRVAAALLPSLLTLNALQADGAGQSHLTRPAWPAPVITPVLEGGDGFRLLESLRQHSAETRELLAVLQAHAAAGLDETYRTNDIVHYDWSPGNLLATGDTISGVIDWEAVCGGDRCFDLVTALLYSYDDLLVREQLWRAVLALVNPRIASVYLAHMLLRQIDWSLRHHTAAGAASWLRTARTVLADCTP